MARRVFFSFHYQHDIFRVNQVRQSWRFQGGESQTFYDRSLWESTQRTGDTAIRKLIDDGMAGTSVTVVLVGAQLDGRRWVDYEIEKSYRDKKGLLAIRIHQLQNLQNETDLPGKNPFDRLIVPGTSPPMPYSSLFPTYDWVLSNGYANLAEWIEASAAARGR